MSALKAKTNNANSYLDDSDSRCGACVLIDFSGAPAAGKQTSLQDAFARFRDQRKAERRLMKASYAPGTRSQEYRDQLRAKFIEQAKAYMGVPYHRRYREEGQPEAPLYLDCCGLVRQCLKDLKEEFGFVIGRWNQVLCIQCSFLMVAFLKLSAIACPVVLSNGCPSRHWNYRCVSTEAR
jgi:hypothetical protein